MPTPYEEVIEEDFLDEPSDFDYDDYEEDEEMTWGEWITSYMFIVFVAASAFFAFVYIYPDNDASKWFQENVADKAWEAAGYTTTEAPTTTAAPVGPSQSDRILNGMTSFVILAALAAVDQALMANRNKFASQTPVVRVVVGALLLMSLVFGVVTLDSGGGVWGYATIFVLMGLALAVSMLPRIPKDASGHIRTNVAIIATICLAVLILRQMSIVIIHGFTFLMNALISIVVLGASVFLLIKVWPEVQKAQP